MINQFLPKTTSKLYSLRKLYFYLAVLLYNMGFYELQKGKGNGSVREVFIND